MMGLSLTWQLDCSIIPRCGWQHSLSMLVRERYGSRTDKCMIPDYEIQCVRFIFCTLYFDLWLQTLVYFACRNLCVTSVDLSCVRKFNLCVCDLCIASYKTCRLFFAVVASRYKVLWPASVCCLAVSIFDGVMFCKWMWFCSLMENSLVSQLEGCLMFYVNCNHHAICTFPEFMKSVVCYQNLHCVLH